VAVRITIGGSAKQWWALARDAVDAGTAPEALLPLLNGFEGEVTVDSDTWRAIWGWAQGMDGWIESDGQEQLAAEFDPPDRRADHGS
jgi:hypothetical protein